MIAGIGRRREGSTPVRARRYVLTRDNRIADAAAFAGTFRAIVRRAGLDGKSGAVQAKDRCLLREFFLQECANYFAAAGYEPV